jgi:hypothetical protein
MLCSAFLFLSSIYLGNVLIANATVTSTILNVGVGNAGGPGGYVAFDSNATISNLARGWNDVAFSFTPTSTYTIYYVRIPFARNGSLDLNLCLVGDTAGHPSYTADTAPSSTCQRYTNASINDAWSSGIGNATTFAPNAADRTIALNDPAPNVAVLVNSDVTWSINANTKYWFVWSATNSSANSSQYQTGYDPDSHTSTTMYAGFTGGSWVTPMPDVNTLGSIQTIIVGDVGQPPPDRAITLTLPKNGTSTADFIQGFWQGSSTLPISDDDPPTSDPYIFVQYCDNNSTCFIDSGRYLLHSFGFGVPVSWLLNKTQPLHTGGWLAQAFIAQTNQNGATIWATSTIVSFVIPFGITEGVPTTTIAADCTAVESITSSTFFQDPLLYLTNGVKYGVCRALTFTFIPNAAQINDLGQHLGAVKNTLATKPPFGYFDSLGTISQISTTTASTTPVILSSSTRASMASVLDPIDGFFAAFLGIIGSFGLYHKLRNIEL